MNADFWGIPTLDLALQAEELVAPVTKWGVIPRAAPMRGTYHFYTDDYKFSALIDSPRLPLVGGMAVAVEPNFTISPETPKVEALFWTYQKRCIARFWQEHGVRIVVDLNIDSEGRHHDIALLGVPHGWRAYATRRHKCVPMDAIWRERDLAVAHAGTTDILFCVFGGGRKMRDLCRKHGMTWIPEHRHVVAGIEQAYGEGR